MESGGFTRDYILHIPPGYGSVASPLVLLFHGFALDGRVMLDYSALGSIADRENFVVVSPTGTGDPHRWNSTAGGGGADDLLFVNDLLDKLEMQLCLDPERVFATGYSNGGGMSMRLACDAYDRVKAVGLVAAVFQPCTPKAPLIAFHGTADALVAFEGRVAQATPGGTPGPESSGFPAIRQAVETWAAALGCAATPNVSNPTEHVELSAYPGCSSNNGAVQLYVVDGGGHTWPGADLFNDTTITTQEIDASELIWEFFESYPQ
jgi:polyhydroxybutyrate depolymerase